MVFPRQEYENECVLLQGIFSTQGSNLHPLHCQMDPLPLSHQGSPHSRYLGFKVKENGHCPFSAVILCYPSYSRIWKISLPTSLIIKLLVLLQQKLLNIMRSVWEKIQENKINLNRETNKIRTWDVSTKFYFIQHKRGTHDVYSKPMFELNILMFMFQYGWPTNYKRLSCNHVERSPSLCRISF